MHVSHVKNMRVPRSDSMSKRKRVTFKTKYGKTTFLAKQNVRATPEALRKKSYKRAKKIDSARFFRVYPNLPMMERENVCCAVEVGILLPNEPISWHIAYLEIKGKTKLGDKILEKLAGMELI